MKLTLLDARLVHSTERGWLDVATLDEANGILFQCPKCAADCAPAPDGGFAGAHYVLVFFANPADGIVAPAAIDGNPRWQVSGTSLEDLTLSPSINLDVPANRGGCGWHGFVRDGDAA